MIGKIHVRNFRWFVAVMLVDACVERIDFEAPPAHSQLVVEGMITDNPGPYTVKLSRAFGLDADSIVSNPVQQAQIRLYDDLGNTEDFIETTPGVYRTSGIISGQVGRAYHIRIETPEGQVFESEPDRINPVGEVEDIRFEFEPRTVVESFGEVKADVFNIYVDSRTWAEAGTEIYTRWRFTGTYEVITYPELHFTHTPPYSPYKNPFPCSGFILLPGPPGSGGTLMQVEDCTCCTCWANHFEETPQLSDTQLISGNEFRNVKVGEVPINNATFHAKYRVEVEQMSLSRTAFDFLKLVREQKENASSLFQPPSGEIRGNVKAINNNNPVIGLVWATSVTKKSIFIHRSDVPYPVTPIDFITLPCYDFYPNATATKPDNWE